MATLLVEAFTYAFFLRFTIGLVGQITFKTQFFWRPHPIVAAVVLGVMVVTGGSFVGLTPVQGVFVFIPEVVMLGISFFKWASSRRHFNIKVAEGVKAHLAKEEDERLKEVATSNTNAKVLISTLKDL